jgi:DNA-binding transcriptional ArsR family regulator
MRGDVVPPARGGLEEDTGLLRRALADPTRRQILDLLRRWPLITGEIAAPRTSPLSSAAGTSDTFSLDPQAFSSGRQDGLPVRVGEPEAV